MVALWFYEVSNMYVFRFNLYFTSRYPETFNDQCLDNASPLPTNGFLLVITSLFYISITF